MYKCQPKQNTEIEKTKPEDTTIKQRDIAGDIPNAV